MSDAPTWAQLPSAWYTWVGVGHDLDNREPQAIEPEVKAPGDDAVDIANTLLADGSADDSTLPSDGTGTLRGASYGRFVVLETIGAGGMGVVCSAYDPTLDRKVALKLLHADPSGSPGLQRVQRGRLLREAQAMARLAHPNVATVFEAGVVDDQVFLAMEYVEGGSLEQWLASERSAADIITAFRFAGRGLVAAHKVGIVHRDFKPANVLVRADERVMVTDFGLAVLAEQADTTTHDSAGDSGEAKPSSFTIPGAIMGTPRYMSPEQHRGEEATARSDQFSFCVALYQALYGKTPFPGDKRKQVLAAIEADAPAFPERADVPAKVREAMRRGLRHDPAERFDSMQALLDQLAPPPEPRGWPWLLGAIVAGLSVAVVIGMAFRSKPAAKPAAACPDSRAQLAGVWDDGRRTALRSHFATSKSNYAPMVSDKVARIFDDYATSWATTHGEVCRATHVRGEQSERLLDVRMDCLKRRKRQLDLTLAALSKPMNPRLLARSIRIAGTLPDVAECATARVPQLERPLPKDPGQRNSIDDLRKRLDALTVSVRLGDLKPSLAKLPALIDEAAKLGYPELHAEALLLKSRALADSAKYADATKAMYDGAAQAAKARNERVVAKAWIEALYVVGVRLRRTKEAQLIIQVARAALERADAGPGLRADFESHYAAFLYHLGDYKTAVERNKVALDLRTNHYGANAPQTAVSVRNLADSYRQLGEYDKAIPLYKRALAMWKAVLFDDHPRVADTLTNLADVYLSRRELGAARNAQQRALEINKRFLGDKHPRVATSMVNIAVSHMSRREYAPAEKLLHQALAIRKARLGAKHPLVGDLYGKLGLIHRGRGNTELAVKSYERAVAIQGADHPDGAVSLFNIGDVLRTGKDCARANTYYRPALRVFETKMGPKHTFTAVALASVGACDAELGKVDAGIKMLEQALAILGSKKNQHYRAETAWRLASTLWQAKRDRKRAVALARSAHAVYAKMKGYTKEATEIKAWLGTNGGGK